MRLNNYQVPNREIKVTAEIEFKSSSLGAQTSSTDTAHKGISPKSVTVELMIRHKEPDLLTELVKTAEALKADGSLQEYTVVDDLCKAMNIRQVTFSDRLSVRDAGTLKAWNVSFTLTEYKSVPEKAEARVSKTTTKAQTAEGTPVTPPEDAESNQPQSMMERMLAGFESKLG